MALKPSIDRGGLRWDQSSYKHIMHIRIVDASLAVSAMGYETTSRSWLSSDIDERTDMTRRQ